MMDTYNLLGHELFREPGSKRPILQLEIQLPGEAHTTGVELAVTPDQAKGLMGALSFIAHER